MVPSSRFCHSMWISWWTKRSLGKFFSGFLPFSPTTNFIPPILHYHLINFVSFHIISSEPVMMWQAWSAGILSTHWPSTGISSYLIPRPGPVSDTALDVNFWEKNVRHSRDSNHRSPVLRTVALTNKATVIRIPTRKQTSLPFWYTTFSILMSNI